MEDPSTLWLFRENSACVEGNIMAQKTEDPAVFTVDCKCPRPVPAGPPTPTPVRPPMRLRTSSAPSASQQQGRVRPCFSCVYTTKGTRRGDEAWGPHSLWGGLSPPGPCAPCLAREDSRTASVSLRHPCGRAGGGRCRDASEGRRAETSLLGAQRPVAPYTCPQKPDLCINTLCICLSVLEPASGTFWASPASPPAFLYPTGPVPRA